MREKFSLIFSLFVVILSTSLISSCVESEITVSRLPDSATTTTTTTTTTTISGKAIDVFTNLPLTDTWLCLSDGETCVQTDAEGNYTFEDIPYGEHTVTPYENDKTTVRKCSDGGSNDCKSFTFTVDENTPTTGFQISSGDSVKLSGSMTIITTWTDLDGGGINDQDLDVHLIIPLGGDCTTPAASDTRRFNDDSGNPHTILDFRSILTGGSAFGFDDSPFATLDLDDLGRDSTVTTKMETLKIKLNGDGSLKCPGVYHFYLNNFNNSPAGTTNFSDLNANVRVLVDGRVEAEYEADDSGGNKYWGVFNINQDGTQTSIKSLSPSIEYNDDCEDLYPEINGSGKCADANN